LLAPDDFISSARRLTLTVPIACDRNPRGRYIITMPAAARFLTAAGYGN